MDMMRTPASPSGSTRSARSALRLNDIGFVFFGVEVRIRGRSGCAGWLRLMGIAGMEPWGGKNAVVGANSHSMNATQRTHLTERCVPHPSDTVRPVEKSIACASPGLSLSAANVQNGSGAVPGNMDTSIFGAGRLATRVSNSDFFGRRQPWVPPTTRPLQ